MNRRRMLGLVLFAAIGAGCTLSHRTETHNASSLVSFLYPNGNTPPLQNAIPELRVPLRVGLAFLPSQSFAGDAALDAPHRQELLEQIRRRFLDRKFVSEIVIIPDYYLTTGKGFEGLAGVQRLYNVDLVALVSYDQVIYREDNKYALGYWTIVGAYVVKGTVNDTITLVDLAVVDPQTRSLVLRAGGTDTHHQNSTWVDMPRSVRMGSSEGFDAATSRMIGNFDAALSAFETDVHQGRANVHVTRRASSDGGGGGAIAIGDIAALSAFLLLSMLKQKRKTSAARPRPPASHPFLRYTGVTASWAAAPHRRARAECSRLWPRGSGDPRIPSRSRG